MAQKDLSLEERQLALQERLVAIQEAQLEQQRASTVVQKAQLKQTAKKSNDMPHGISAFNPRGEKDFPMPRLKCPIEFAYPINPNSHALTREEVELFNLLQPGIYRIDLNDGTSAIAHVTQTINTLTGQVELLSFNGTPDEKGNPTSLFDKRRPEMFRAMPSLAKMLRDMIGEPAQSVQTMKAERAAIAQELVEVAAGSRDISDVLSQGA